LLYYFYYFYHYFLYILLLLLSLLLFLFFLNIIFIIIIIIVQYVSVQPITLWLLARFSYYNKCVCCIGALPSLHYLYIIYQHKLFIMRKKTIIERSTWFVRPWYS